MRRDRNPPLGVDQLDRLIRAQDQQPLGGGGEVGRRHLTERGRATTHRTHERGPDHANAAGRVGHSDREPVAVAQQRERARRRAVDHHGLARTVERGPQPDPAELVGGRRGEPIGRHAKRRDLRAVCSAQRRW
ncbi:MAG TPA: hypothetical protein VHW23_22175 [Kofleriaceae bacterium]|nr:hypothetical protein [Kofleriaceae bacterium]